MSNMDKWDAMKRPPITALKTIQAGRLKGMSDVNPQWRIQVMTEVFGACGIGWYYTVERFWAEQGAAGEVMCFVHIHLYTKTLEGWSAPITGIGGSALVAKESAGLRANDEGYKMATTDALSVAMKQLGVAADIYMGLWDGSKYKEPVPNKNTPVAAAIASVPPINDEDMEYLKDLAGSLVDDVETRNEVVFAFDKLEGAKLDSDQKLILWDLMKMNSKTRSALKAEGDKRRKTQSLAGGNAVGQQGSAYGGLEPHNA